MSGPGSLRRQRALPRCRGRGWRDCRDCRGRPGWRYCRDCRDRRDCRGQGSWRDCRSWPGWRYCRGRGDCRGEDGFVGGFEGLLFGTLFFIVGTLLIGFAWGVVDTKAAAELAARQAVRTYVEAPTAAEASSGATQAADSALLGYGRNPLYARISLVTGQFSRCGRVTITVSYPAPIVDLPGIGRLGRGETVSGSHTELVDPFRSGLAGTSSCG